MLEVTMENTSEANKLLVENITERVEATHESYQSISIEGKIVEERRTMTYENTREIVTTVDQPSENDLRGLSVEENSCILQENNSAEVNVANAINETTENTYQTENVTESNPEVNLESENVSDVTEVINDKVEVGDNIETISGSAIEESTPTTQKYQENEAKKGPSAQSEYTSEYMLEHQAENVYMPDQEQEDANTVSEQVYATEMISDDSQDNNTTTEAQSSPVEAEAATNEAEPVIEQSENINLPSTLHESRQGSVKTEVLNVETENVEDRHQNLDDSVNNEGSVVEEISSKEADEGSNREEDSYNIKLEGTPMEVDINQPEFVNVDENPSIVDEPQIIDERVEQPMEQEKANDVVNVDLTNVSTGSTQLQSYTLPEGLEVTEIQGEYTIVEGPSSLEISTAQQDEEGNTDGTLVLLENYEHSDSYEQSEEGTLVLSDDQQELYMTELRSQAESRQSTSSQSSESKPRRGRKPTFDIPMHVLGHDISKPVESVPNGRALPKPRLGVKVPYRNLTSQIVSKAEIEKEIMERARLKQEQANARGDVLFARKLTQRLARKIAPSPNHPKRAAVDKSKISESEKKAPEPSVTETNIAEAETQKIHNDSDLLAILEGEGEEMPVLPKEVPRPQPDEVDVRMLEREIALQQLQELPHQEPKQRVFRGRQAKPEAKAPVLTPEASALAKAKTTTATKQPAPSPAQISKKTDLPPQVASSDKENTSKQPKEATSISTRKDQGRIDLTVPSKRQPVEVEPQVKVNMVLKTYSRKRKTIELSEPFPESPVPKKPMLSESDIKMEKDAAPSDVYVTKSSRVIKKKVIWDPDEIPVRSPKPAKTDSPVKTVKPVDKVGERVAEKKPAAEKVVKEKPPEKKAAEKPSPKKAVNEKGASPMEKKAPKTDSPKNSKTPTKLKKSLSEVDKLLMDEGAVKMLYDLKNTDDVPPRKKKDVYSVERAQKDLLKKANEIKNDLQQNTSNESPKSLRKKEALLPSLMKPALITSNTDRKMSKDSTRSSVHTPPGSPAYSFSHSQSSMLVRRRSSSSISSSDEVSTDDNAKGIRKKSLTDGIKPKKVRKSEVPKEKEKEEVEEPKPANVENKQSQFRSFAVKKTSKHVTIDLNYGDEKCYCTVQVLEELTVALKKFAKEKDCNVVSITSSGKEFCLGLDYASLVSDQEDVRKKNATDLSGRVRDFLLCLLHFPKVLVAGIQGDCVGLGVTMLPLFDMVIASDTATFSCPYTSMGCMAEAGYLLSSPHISNHGLAAELLFTTQKLTADDVFRRGLISRLCWPEKYNETLKTILTSISKGSKQSLEATKKQLRRHIVQTTEAAINSESKLLVEHWMGAECQRNFARLAEDGN